MRYSDFLAGEAVKDSFHDPFRKKPTPVKEGVMPTDVIELAEGQRHDVPLHRLPGEVAARLNDRLDAVTIFRFHGGYGLDVRASHDFFNALPIADFDWPVTDVCAYRDARSTVIHTAVRQYISGAQIETFVGTKIVYGQDILLDGPASYAHILDALDTDDGLHILTISHRLRKDIETMLQNHDATPLAPHDDLDRAEQMRFATEYADALLDGLTDAQWSNNVSGDWHQPYWTDATRRQIIGLAKTFYAQCRGDITDLVANNGPAPEQIALELAHCHSFPGEQLTGRTLHEDIIFKRIQYVADAHFPKYSVAADGEVQISEGDNV